MQQVQQRELPERISWARAMIFAVGFFFLAAILIGQLPGYIYNSMTAASLDGLERGLFDLGLVFLGGFVVVMVIVMLFDPKPIIPPITFTGLGAILAVVGLALSVWATSTGCTPQVHTCNQYFPSANMSWNPILGGQFLWFQANTFDLTALGLVVLGVGLAMIFYSVLAMREQTNPDRRDLGTTPAIRGMIIGATALLVLFLIIYTYINDQGLAAQLFPKNPFFGLKLVDLIASIILGVALLLALGAFALRLHYLMRPVRKRVMAPLYLVGALGLAQTGAVLLLAWIVVYPLLAWIHTWSFIGLNDYLTVCSKPNDIPGGCTFSQQSGYIIDTVVTSNFFFVLMAAVWAWKSHRNLVVIGSVVSTAVIAAATLLIHVNLDQLLVAMMLTIGMLILAVVWTSVARREFAVIGENKLGCVGQWLVVGTCLFIYLGSFAFFSLASWPPETEPNVPFIGGLQIPPPTVVGQAPPIPQADAVVMVAIMGILAAIQFYFLIRNRYKV